jgi:Tol biopolymer transport system component
MRRAIAASRALAVAASLAAASLTIAAAPTAAADPAPGRIAFSDFVTNQIYTVNPDGTALAQLTHEPNGIAARWPSWSPNGSRILFDRLKLSNFVGRIWIMNADGTGQRRLVSDVPGHSDLQPAFFPDGRRIVFTRCLPNFEHCAIWIMRSNGTHRHLVVPFIPAPNETNNFDAKVSPDGRRISFTRFGFHGVNSQVWVARINGTHARPLTAPRLEASGPAWSPDGSHIAFASNSFRPQSSIYVMRADGSGVTRLATTKWPTNNFGPSYAPGGGRIAFSSDRRHPDQPCEAPDAKRANRSRPHRGATGLQAVIAVPSGTAPPVPAGSPGTLSHPPAGAPATGASRHVGCYKAPAC